MAVVPFLFGRRYMTYKEFKTGLYVKYHMSYVKSVLFIKFDKLKGESVSGWENLIILKVDAENVLKEIKNKNMVKALCLIAQGYFYEDIARELGLSKRTIRRYVNKIKNNLENNVPF